MSFSDFHFDLPAAQIAQQPLSERSASRLLRVPQHAGDPEDLEFSNLGAYLQEGDLLVMNDTRVIPARMHGQKASGGKIELLLERALLTDTALVQLKANRSPSIGSILALDGGATATVTGRRDGFFELRFDGEVEKIFAAHGHMPLPPYIRRGDTSLDRDRYQTVFARQPGAVAAPTAGLHFDEPQLADLQAAGVRVEYLTLHVGAGTFQPLRPEQIESGELHAERIEVPAALCEAVAATKDGGGRVIAVGTTSVRALETAARSGVLEPYSGETTLFIQPGFRFNVVDVLLTNFHLPGSSLLMLVCAFAGQRSILAAYEHAVTAGYRFFSYGDAMLCYRHEQD